MAKKLKEQSVNTARLFESVVHTDVGLRRSENQDSYCVLERSEYCFYALADGMGGAAGGSAASGLAIEAAKEYLETKRLVSEPVLREALRLANKNVFERSQEDLAYKGMGTTFVALAFAGTDMFVANVGDSRAYRFRKGRLTRLTEDHTFRVLLEQSGVLSSENVQESPMSHLLTRSIGTSEEVEIDCWRSTDPPLANDIYLLCTDGLHGYLKEYEIARELETCPFEKVAEELINIANERGGHDNATVIAARVQKGFSIKSTVSSEVSRAKVNAIKEAGHSAFTWFRTQGLPLVFLFGFLLGALLFNLDWVTQRAGTHNIMDTSGHSDAQTGMEFAANTALLPPVGIPGEQPVYPPINIEAITAQGTGAALAQLQEYLEQVRARIEMATRKLSVWHKRREDFFNDVEIKSLSAQVAVSVPSVRQKIEAVQRAEWEYLREAEELLYNPADLTQEAKVSQLRNTRNERAAELRAELQRVIDTAVGRELYRIRQLSARRDQVQAAIEEVKQRIGSSVPSVL